MSDLTKDRDEYHRWAKSRIKKSKDPVMHLEIWQAACAYKDKRIAELEAELREAYNRIAELDSVLNSD